MALTNQELMAAFRKPVAPDLQEGVYNATIKGIECPAADAADQKIVVLLELEGGRVVRKFMSSEKNFEVAGAQLKRQFGLGDRADLGFADVAYECMAKFDKKGKEIKPAAPVKVFVSFADNPGGDRPFPNFDFEKTAPRKATTGTVQAVAAADDEKIA